MKRAINCAIAGLALCLPAIAAAQAPAAAYPTKPVRIIVPFPAGGPLDTAARLFGEKLTAALGQQFVVENRAGATGNIGAEAAARSAPDGYTLMYALDVTMTVNPSLFARLPFDPVKDFAPVALATTLTQVLVVHPSVPARSVAELVAVARKQPLSYASGGNGTPGHLSGELFKTTAGVDLLHVPYKGNAPAVTDLLGGQVQVFFSALPGVLPHIKSGKLRALAVTSAARSPALPDVPTMAEAGVPFEVTSWFAFFAPAGTPQPVIATLAREIARAMAMRDVQERVKALGLNPVVGGPDEVAGLIRRDTPKWAKVVKDAKMKVD